MKINVEVHCSPEEARRFMGLPDMAPVHDALIAQMQDTLKNGVSPDFMMSIMKSWSPMGDAGMKMWQGLIDQIVTSQTR